MNKKILFVDDEPHILEGYQRVLRKQFDIFTAAGGEQAIATLENSDEFSVIVSDMRMPGMDGVRFLGRAAEISPNTVRIMLTGDAEQQTAMSAVNEGRIFRFLTKPCTPEALGKTIAAGIEQYSLITAEKELLEETLSKSLEVMVDILATVNPTAFSRSARVKRMARDIAARLGLENVWELEIAATLSQIGCIGVPEEILQKIAACQPLDERELRLYCRHAQVGCDLVKRIPRMETVAEIIANQNRRVSDEIKADSLSATAAKATTSARVLKAALDFDKLLDFGDTPHDAFAALAARDGWYDSVVLDALKEIIEENVEQYTSEPVSVGHLKMGMLVDEPVISNRGLVLLDAGQEITLSVILRLNNFAEAGIIKDKIRARVPIRHSREEVFSLLNRDGERLLQAA